MKSFPNPLVHDDEHDVAELNARGRWDEHARSSIASYLGWMKWCDASGLEAKYIMPLLKAIGGTV